MKTRPFIQGTLIAAASLVVGMVIAARLDLTPSSLAGTFSTPTVNTAPLTGPIDATTFRTIAQVASPSVVSISVQVKAQAQPWGDLFGFQMPGRRGRGAQPPPQEEYNAGAGSGFIIDKSGLILTNNHVVDDAVKIEVAFADSRTGDSLYAAEIVGRDELTDTALIRLKQMPDHPLTEIKFGDSGQMAPGDWVMAIGNPFRLSNSVSVGIVSAVGRPYRASVSATGASRWEEMIQTDAAINRGNSGGPLLNIRGEVVGINTMIYSDNSTGGNIGIGFAVPINRVLTLLPQLKEGKITRGRIGVELSGTRLTKEDAEDRGLPSIGGAVVSNVDEQGPAKAAGIKMDDVVIEFNGKPVKDNDSLINMVTGTAPGTTVPIKVVRDKKTLTLSVKVDELNLAQERGGQETASAPSARGGGDVSKETGFGMRIQELTPSDARDLRVPGKAGAIVTRIDPLGTAAQSGVAEGDVILRINGEAMTNLDQVSKALDSVGSGRTARIVVWSQGREQLLLVRKR